MGLIRRAHHWAFASMTEAVFSQFLASFSYFLSDTAAAHSEPCTRRQSGCFRKAVRAAPIKATRPEGRHKPARWAPAIGAAWTRAASVARKTIEAGSVLVQDAAGSAPAQAKMMCKRRTYALPSTS